MGPVGAAAAAVAAPPEALTRRPGVRVAHALSSMSQVSQESVGRTAKNAHVQFDVGGVVHEAAFDAGFNPPPIGMPVWVLYEPSNPRRNYVVGKLSY
jgi:hypothetical protein